MLRERTRVGLKFALATRGALEDAAGQHFKLFTERVEQKTENNEGLRIQIVHGGAERPKKKSPQKERRI
jgi:hypothetical protein